MADIYFFQDDDQDDGDGVYGDSDSTSINPDDLLPPVHKLEKYAESDNIFNRQIVARTVLETLRVVTGQTEDVTAVLNVMNKLADDVEPSVRSELMEQVPHIAMYCQEYKTQLEHVVPDHLLPMVVKFLTDTNNQVRKTSQAALLVLLEQGLVEKSDVQEQVCPVIIRLTEADSLDDYRTEAVALLSKMAPLIGKEMTESVFLERFAALCVDPLFHVRKVCAANFGDFSNVVGCEPTEQVLLPKFFYLCEDGVWGVRKACADVFMPVSCVCSQSVRRTELAPLFINLLRDQSRWVRMAAFQALGPFISTFADPAITALLHNDNGEIVIADADLLAQRLDELEVQRAQKRQAEDVERDLKERSDLEAEKSVASGELPPSTKSTSSIDAPVIVNSSETSSSSSHVIDMEICSDEIVNDNQLMVQEKDRSLEEERAAAYQSRVAAADSFNTFQFWREPVPSIILPELKSKEEEVKPDNVALVEKESPEVTKEVVKPEEIDLPHENEFEDDEDEMEIEPLFGDDEDYDDSRVEELHKLENHLKRVLDKGNKEMDHLTQELSEARLGSQTGDSNEGSTMELFRWGNVQKSPSTSTFDPRRDNPTRPSTRMPMKAEDLQPPDPALPKGPPEVEQDIVPQLLIDHYVSMIDPSRAQTVDSEIARHCAFALPAVALTLGRANWPLVKDTYDALASDMQWKVRRTLASSIHELGIILGDEAAGQDLIPIFNGFFKDLDEVRIGILKHLADFLRMLKPQARREYLPRLSEFLKMDNDRNWRFRQELADQLGLLVPLYSPQEVKDFLAPIALVLVRDKVAAVRHSAITVHIEMVRTLLSSENPDLARNLLTNLIGQLASAERWVHRQTFAIFCQRVFSDPSLDHDKVSNEVLSQMLDLAWDNVPNVRLAVAKAVCQIKATKYFEKDAPNPTRDRVEEATAYLASDKDSDVRSIFHPQTSSPEKFYDSDGEPIGDVSSLPV